MFAVRHQKAHPKAQFSNKINQPDRIGRRRRRRRAHTHTPAGTFPRRPTTLPP